MLHIPTVYIRPLLSCPVYPAVRQSCPIALINTITYKYGCTPIHVGLTTVRWPCLIDPTQRGRSWMEDAAQLARRLRIRVCQPRQARACSLKTPARRKGSELLSCSPTGSEPVGTRRCSTWSLASGSTPQARPCATSAPRAAAATKGRAGAGVHARHVILARATGAALPPSERERHHQPAGGTQWPSLLAASRRKRVHSAAAAAEAGGMQLYQRARGPAAQAPSAGAPHPRRCATGLQSVGWVAHARASRVARHYERAPHRTPHGRRREIQRPGVRYAPHGCHRRRALPGVAGGGDSGGGSESESESSEGEGAARPGVAAAARARAPRRRRPGAARARAPCAGAAAAMRARARVARRRRLRRWQR